MNLSALFKGVVQASKGTQDTEVKAQLAELLLAQGTRTLVAGMVTVLCLFVAFHGEVNPVRLNLWAGAVTLVSLLRVWLIFHWRRSGISGDRLLRHYSLLAGLGGLCWAGVLALYEPGQPVVTHTLVLMTLVGMPATALSTNAVHLPVFLAFSTPLFVTLVGWGWFLAPTHGGLFSVIAAMYAALVLHAATRFASYLNSSLERDLQRQSLLDELKTANGQLEQLAYRDPLTSLSNRRLFEKSARRTMGSMEPGAKLVLVLIDVDSFKAVNDNLGHEAGDKLLVELSRRIQSSCRETDFVIHGEPEAARIGGDEFILLLHVKGNTDVAITVAERMWRVLIRPMDLAGRIYSPAVSIGVAVAPDHARELPELIRRADEAMYAIKHAGGNGYKVVDLEDPDEGISNRSPGGCSA